MDISSRGRIGQTVRSRVLTEVRHVNEFAQNQSMVEMIAWVLTTKKGIAVWLNVPVIHSLFECSSAIYNKCVYISYARQVAFARVRKHVCVCVRVCVYNSQVIFVTA